MSDVIKVVSDLVARASTLDGDGNPSEEARTSAWLACKLMRQHGLTVTDVVRTSPPAPRSSRAAAAGGAPDWWTRVMHSNAVKDFFQGIGRDIAESTLEVLERPPAPKRRRAARRMRRV